MAQYDRRDVERVMNASFLDRTSAEMLLERYGGSPERAIREGLGQQIIVVEAENVTDQPMGLYARAAEALKRGLKPALWLAVPGALLAGLIGALAGGKKAGGGFSFS